ncbi:MAG: DUF4253 domain-containing protein [Oscillospiraceae bacterium]|nr:DUF4253 domain-containing protein [Oscillospiraceae bacterium]
MQNIANEIADLLGCPAELIPAAAGGSAIYRRYQMLQRQGQGSFTPVVIYPTKQLLENMQRNLTAANAETCVEYARAMLPAAQAIDPLQLLQQRMNALVQSVESVEKLLGEFLPARPADDKNRLCQSCRNHARNGVLIAQCPTQNPWELPLFVPMGGSGLCPAPVEQAAVLQFWQQHVQAVPVVAGYDIWELLVAQPPMQVFEAERLALQQFAFAPDLVRQAHRDDADTIRALASHLQGAKAWYFYWHA